MNQSIINFSQLEDRIDATFYKQEFLETENFLANNPYTKTIGEVSNKVKDGPGGWNVSKRDYTPHDDGVPFLGASDIKEGVIDLEGVTRIYPTKHQELKASALRPKDVLLSVRGTPGFSAVVPDNLKECNISAALVLIRLRSNINPIYISLFLSSKHGRNQTERLGFKAVQADINLTEVRSIKIPIPPPSFQQHIEDLVRKAHYKRKQADEKYKEAEELLEKELRLKNLDLSTEKTYQANFSEIERTGASRFDAEYFQPKYKILLKKLKRKGTRKLSKVIKISPKKLDPTKIPTARIKYIELANINSSHGTTEDVDDYLHWQLPGRARMIIKTGDVLVSSVSGSADKVALVQNEYDNQVASTGFFVIRSEKFTPQVLFLLFRNKALKWQLVQKTAGAILAAISREDFGDLLVPRISKSTQQKISKLIQQSFKLHKESKALIEKAKRKVETSIKAQSKGDD